MKIQAEVSLYPLRTQSLAEPIDRFVRELRRGNLEIEMCTMSTRVSGDCTELFQLLGTAFDHTARDRDSVLVVKISNTCPSDPRQNMDS